MDFSPSRGLLKGVFRAPAQEKRVRIFFTGRPREERVRIFFRGPGSGGARTDFFGRRAEKSILAAYGFFTGPENPHAPRMDFSFEKILTRPNKNFLTPEPLATTILQNHTMKNNARLWLNEQI